MMIQCILTELLECKVRKSCSCLPASTLFWTFELQHPVSRVATDLESLGKSRYLKETPENQGICLKIQGICDRIPKVRDFVVWNSFSANLKILILKIFLGSMPPDPLNALGITEKLNLGQEKAGKSQGVSYCLESGNPVSGNIRSQWFFDNFWSAFNALSVCVSWFLIELLQFLPNLNHMFSYGLNSLGLNLKAYISKATRNRHIQHWFSHCRCNVASFKSKHNFLTKWCNRSPKKIFGFRTVMPDSWEALLLLCKIYICFYANVLSVYYINRLLTSDWLDPLWTCSRKFVDFNWT